MPSKITDLKQHAVTVWRCRQQAKELKASESDSNQSAIALMQSLGRTELEFTPEKDVVLNVKLVQPESVTIDYDALRKAIGKEKYAAICKTVPDYGLLEEAVKRGDIATSTVAKVSTVKQGTPSLRFATKEA